MLLKYSRSAESDADLLGAYTMAKAGYNPVEMARFFERLEAERKGKTPKFVEIFTASHPNPGNRVKAIEEQLPFMPRGPYDAAEGDLKKMQSVAASLPKVSRPAQPGQDAAPAPLPNASKPAQVPVSSRMRSYRGGGFSIQYPDNWRVRRSQSSVTIAPAEGLVQGHVGYGVILNRATLQRAVSLERDTQALIDSLSRQNTNMRVAGQAQRITVGNRRALVTKLSSDSPYAGLREIDVLITVDLDNELFSVICVAPLPDFPAFEPVFQGMVRSVAFD